jgi:hypothetical protein
MSTAVLVEEMYTGTSSVLGSEKEYKKKLYLNLML